MVLDCLEGAVEEAMMDVRTIYEIPALICSRRDGFMDLSTSMGEGVFVGLNVTMEARMWRVWRDVVLALTVGADAGAVGMASIRSWCAAQRKGG